MSKYFCNIFKNSKKIFAIILSLALILGTYQAYGENLNTVKLVIDNKIKNIKTNEATVGEFLKKQGIIINSKDKINLDLETEIKDEIKIIINKSKTVIFNIDEKEKIEFLTNSENIGKAINELSKELNREFKLSSGQSSASKIEDNMEINILEYQEEYKTVSSEIAYSSKTVENYSLLEGNKNVKVKGQNGIKETLIKEIYLDGELISTETISETILKAPVEEIIEVGKKSKDKIIKTEKGTFKVEKELTMKSTAYTSSVECTGKTPKDSGYGVTASGIKAQVGVVAVDPKVIPLGTKLYIDGYGYAIAGDTGGAIKGNKIDVYFNTYKEAVNYGVKNVKVYILGNKI